MVVAVVVVVVKEDPEVLLLLRAVVFYRKEPLSASRLFFSLAQTQTIACFELSDFFGCIGPLQWLYGQLPWHTLETEHNGYPQFTSGFNPILRLCVCLCLCVCGWSVGCLFVCAFVCLCVCLFVWC